MTDTEIAATKTEWTQQELCDEAKRRFDAEIVDTPEIDQEALLNAEMTFASTDAPTGRARLRDAIAAYLYAAQEGAREGRYPSMDDTRAAVARDRQRLAERQEEDDA